MTSDLPLTRQERLRRTVLLCCACSRNLAYYRCGWNGRKPWFSDEFHATINGNFLDIGLLEWCKLFGDNDEEHHWSTVLSEISARRSFRRGLEQALSCSRGEFNGLRKKILAYRNYFVAHLGSQRKMEFPTLNAVIASAVFYHSFLQENENDGGTFRRLPPDSAEYHQQCLTAGSQFYGHVT